MDGLGCGLGCRVYHKDHGGGGRGVGGLHTHDKDSKKAYLRKSGPTRPPTPTPLRVPVSLLLGAEAQHRCLRLACDLLSKPRKRASGLGLEFICSVGWLSNYPN